MMNWNAVLGTKIGQHTMKKFALNELSGDQTLKVFRSGKDKEVASEVRSLIKKRGTQMARRISRKALRRRGLIS